MRKLSTILAMGLLLVAIGCASNRNVTKSGQFVIQKTDDQTQLSLKQKPNQSAGFQVHPR